MRFIPVAIAILFLSSCSKSITKILKNPDPEYKLKIAEQYYVKKSYNKAQVLFEDVMPYYKTRTEFQDIYYKYAYCAYNQQDYTNAENLFKTFLEIFPNSPKAEEMDYMRAYCYYKQSPKAELDQTNTIKTMGMMQIFINTHPGSVRNKDASAIIDICRNKLEVKEFKSAQLYYDMGSFRAAGVAFTSLLNSYPDSPLGDQYKLMVIKSYFRYAELSVQEKKIERFEQVVDEVKEFLDRYPDSKLRADAENYMTLSQNNIKNLNI